MSLSIRRRLMPLVADGVNGRACDVRVFEFSSPVG
jgi:hypothetical protein